MGGKRIGRSDYWLQIVLQFVGIIVLGTVAVYAFFSGRFMVAILCILMVIPLGIYFRVVQMRRCRDIGWPAFLPWLLFGLILLNMMSTFSNLTDPSQLMTGSTLSMVLSLADFVFMIALGCVEGKRDGDLDPTERNKSSVTLRYSGATDDVSPAGDGGDDPFGDAIARAVDNYKRTGSAVPGSNGAGAPRAAAPAALPAMPPRVAGFGRKAV